MSASTQPGARTRKPRGQGPTRRGEILRAASRIFLEQGIAGATMRRIGAAVGVSPTALYVYFPDKDAILQAIAEATFVALREALEASMGGAEPGMERFRAGMEAYVAFGLANPGLYRLTFLSSPAQRGAKPCETIQAADHSFAILQHGVEELMAAGVFRAGPAEAIAETIWAAMHGITSILLDQADHLATPQHELVRRVLDMVVAGLM